MQNQRPVEVHTSAKREYARLLRTWTGSETTRLTFDNSIPTARWTPSKKTVTVNPDALTLNPNRVIRNVTPFRLKQEAVMTGALMHEAAHSRFSLWQPRTEEAAKAFVHHDGTPVSPAVMDLAKYIEEARIEGRFLAETASARPLAWTFRAMSAHVAPVPDAVLKPGSGVWFMDLVVAWLLRAGRVEAHSLGLYSAAAASQPIPPWVDNFNRAMERAILVINPSLLLNDAKGALNLLLLAVESRDDTGLTVVRYAREFLETVFPNTPLDQMPSPSVSLACSAGEEGADSGSGSGEGDGSEGDGDGEDSEGEDSEGEDSEGDGDGDGDGDGEAAKIMAEVANAINAASREASADRKKEIENAGSGAGSGVSGNSGAKGSRPPTKDDRDMQRGAEALLRRVIAPVETSTVLVTSQPSAQVDGAALAAWRASGSMREPKFFKQVRRSVTIAPPVRIAILVDVSGSMDVMQKPSATLSWALASAASDLRNFAGRGQQIEACMIHWGDNARVVQPVGAPAPADISTAPCREYTDAYGDAMQLIEGQMPGFFDTKPEPENRLIVNFTDWGLGFRAKRNAPVWGARSHQSGVRTLSILPPNVGGGRSQSITDQAIGSADGTPGKSVAIAYTGSTDAVWNEAARLLMDR